MRDLRVAGSCRMDAKRSTPAPMLAKLASMSGTAGAGTTKRQGSLKSRLRSLICMLAKLASMSGTAGTGAATQEAAGVEQWQDGHSCLLVLGIVHAAGFGMAAKPTSTIPYPKSTPLAPVCTEGSCTTALP